MQSGCILQLDQNGVVPKHDRIELDTLNPLTADLTRDQQAVLNLIFSYFHGAGDWPIWQFVDLGLQPPGSALDALSSLPRVRNPDPRNWAQLYALVWWENMAMAGPLDASVARAFRG